MYCHLMFTHYFYLNGRISECIYKYNRLEKLSTWLCKRESSHSPETSNPKTTDKTALRNGKMIERKIK